LTPSQAAAYHLRRINKEITMAALELTLLSPIPVYLDESTEGTGLAPRPASLDGKVVALLPNWRPSAVEILRAVAELLQARFRLKAVIEEQPVRELPIRTGKLLDTMADKLDDLAHRADVVLTATGD
jgi:hypothetical protein